MKKLMIAAAVAAMSVGAMAAADQVGLYKFTASLKTTTDAQKSKSDNYYLNLGFGEAEYVVWWRDLGYETMAQAKAEVNKLIKAYKDGTSVDDYKLFDNLEDFLAAVGWNFSEETVDKKNEVGTYCVKDIKTRKWCSQFTITVKTGDCYRKAGSAKINALVMAPACCETDVTPWEFVQVYKFANLKTDKDGYVAEDTLAAYYKANQIGLGREFAFQTYWRFGGLTAKDASKVEALGYIGTTDYTVVDSFAFGGQGTRTKNDETALNTLSGSIIGTLQNPTCYICCDEFTPACFFDCNNQKYSAKDDADVPLDVNLADPGTVAYGTFTLKYYKPGFFPVEIAK